MIDNEKIGRAIRTLREKAGYTQKELAEQLYISNVAVSKWERGKSVPDTATLQRLAELLDMDVDGLLDGSATYLDERWHGVLLLNSNGLPAETVICDKPLIDYQLSYFLLAGVRDICVACGSADQAFIESRFRGGKVLGIRLRFSSPEKLTAEMVTEGRSGNLMLISVPFFLYGVDLTRFLQRAMTHKSAVVQMSTVVGRDGVKLGEGFSQYEYRPLPVYFVQGQFLSELGPSQPLARVPEMAEKKRRLCMEPMNKGFIVSMLRDEGDIETVSSLLRGIQQLGDCLVCCPLEIAWRRGMITTEKIRETAKAFPEYEAYVERL